MKRVLLAGVLAGLVGFVWGAISWMALPFHLATTKSFAHEETVAVALAAEANGPGLYSIPSMHVAPGPEAEAEHLKKMQHGPVAWVVLRPNGVDPTMARQYVIGFLVEVALGSLLAGLMSLVLATLPTYGRRVVFAACLGVLCALTGPVMEWNWMYYSAESSVVNLVDVIVHLTLMGCVVAAIIKPRD
jgi:hypothetical protein